MKKLFLPLAMLFLGCASLPMLEIHDFNDENSRPKYFYDIESNMAYKIEHDQEYLYLELKSDDETTIQKIVRNGLFVYIDPNAGKSKDIYFNYPLQKKRGKGEMRKMMQQVQKREEPGATRELNVSQMLERLDTEAIYSNKEMAEMIPVFARSKSFKVELSAPTKDQLVYKLRIPKNEIFNEGREKRELSLGIMTGKFEIPTRTGGGQGGPGGRMQDGMGGGRSGGGMQGGGRPGGMNSGMRSSEEIEKMTEQISIWFKVSL